MRGMVKNLFWSIKKSKGFLATSQSTYEFSTLYTTLPHNLIKEELIELVEHTFNREGSFYLFCNEKHTFSLLNNLKDIICDHVCKFLTLSIIFWTINL